MAYRYRYARVVLFEYYGGILQAIRPSVPAGMMVVLLVLVPQQAMGWPQQTPSTPLAAGGLATAPQPLCPSGRPAPVSFLWNIVYAQVPGLKGPGSGVGEGTNLSGVHGVSSQLGMVAYDGGGLGGGYNQPNWGLWPVCNAPPNCDNGGIPQNVSIPAHIAALRAAAEELIPDRATFGVVALDYEGWQPVWDDYLGPQYKRFSEDLVRAEHPSWSPTAVSAEASRQFESAAREFYTVTFKTLRELRPNISWTHHAYPVSICYDNPSARLHNDALLWLYELFDAIMPSIYLQGLPSPSYPCASNEKALLRQLMAEAGRMAEQVGAVRAAATPTPSPGQPAFEARALPVLPIAWLRTEIHNDNRVLNASFFDVEMLTPFEFPYTVAVQVWGNEAFPWPGDDTAVVLPNCSTVLSPGPCDRRINNLMTEHGVAQLDGFVRQRCECAEKRCHGHGVCYGTLAADIRCYCDRGWSGSDCNANSSTSLQVGNQGTSSFAGGSLLSDSHSNQYAPPPPAAVICPDKLAWCPKGSTCAQQSTGPWVCCPLANATICSSRRCCPYNTTCSPKVCHGRVCVEEFCLPLVRHGR